MDRRQWRGDGQGLEDRTASEVPVSVGVSGAVAPVVGMLGFWLGCVCSCGDWAMLLWGRNGSLHSRVWRFRLLVIRLGSRCFCLCLSIGWGDLGGTFWFVLTRLDVLWYKRWQ